jgi:hypothetical protein
MTIELSYHARIQASRRNFSYDDIDFVIRYGHKKHRTGVIFFQMREKKVPRHIPANDPRRRLAGTTVVACSCEEFIITVYKNPKAFKKDSRKVKYNCRQDEICTCPRCGIGFIEEVIQH